jgi:hypothetical protein
MVESRYREVDSAGRLHNATRWRHWQWECPKNHATIRINPAGTQRLALDLPAVRIDNDFRIAIQPYFNLGGAVFLTPKTPRFKRPLGACNASALYGRDRSINIQFQDIQQQVNGG